MTNLIDMYPQRSKLLEKIIDKICILAQSKIRLIRFGFTAAAMGFVKILLHQLHDISQVMARLRSQPTLRGDNESLMSECHDLI